MTVTMINAKNGTEIRGIHVKFISRWKQMGFEVKEFESDKVLMFRAG